MIVGWLAAGVQCRNQNCADHRAEGRGSLVAHAHGSGGGLAILQVKLRGDSSVCGGDQVRLDEPLNGEDDDHDDRSFFGGVEARHVSGRKVNGEAEGDEE